MCFAQLQWVPGVFIFSGKLVRHLGLILGNLGAGRLI